MQFSFKNILLTAALLPSLQACELLNGLQGPERRKAVALYPLGSSKATDLPKSDSPKPEAIRSEDSYIRLRQKSAGVPVGAPLIGVALSGGGMRSGTMSLGILQGLEDGGLLKHVDYLSCVSGGGYAGGWYVSHLRTQKEVAEMQRVGVPANSIDRHFATTRGDLLDISAQKPDNLTHLKHIRDRGGITGTGNARTFRTSKTVAWWLASLGPNLIVDLGLHLQPAAGKWNLSRMFTPYRELLDDIYGVGWEGREYEPHALLASDINRPGSQTPFFISSASMANSKGSAKWKVGRGADNRIPSKLSNNHFEMTSLWCGSPALGYIPTEYFDRSVVSSYAQIDELPIKGEARGEYVRSPTGTVVLAGPTPWITTRPLRLGTAVAISGAAVDSGALSPKVRYTANTLLTAVNFNLRYSAPNFAQEFDWHGLRSRMREATLDRFFKKPWSNSLQLTDGGHFENLGIYALIIRSVPTILAFDCTADSSYGYSDLKNFLKLCIENEWKISADGYVAGIDPKKPIPLPSQFGENAPPQNPVWKFSVTNHRGLTSHVHYIKSSHIANGAGLNFGHPLAHKGVELMALNPAGPNHKELRRKEYPHTGTFKLFGWNPWKFDSYRELGRLMGRVIAEETKDSKRK